MLTIICDTPGQLSAIEREKPVPAKGEALVKIRRVGVCGTDLHIFTGNQPYLSYPRVMGHELAATVEEAPEGSALSAGDTVAIIPTCPAAIVMPASRAAPIAAAISACSAFTAMAA
jgi:threonine dehydrogenase-like Zn-dependent dehydrogenase